MPGLDGYGVIAALRADAETVTIPFIFLTAKAEKLDIRAGMNLGADDYLTKPVAKVDLLAAIHSRLERAVQQAVPEFKPNFRSAIPLEKVLGLTTRVAETLLWLAQGKTNGEIATHSRQQRIHGKKTCLRNFRKARPRNPNRSQLARSRSAQFASGSPISLYPNATCRGSRREEGGHLFEAVPRRPYFVVLFDEIEKAHQEDFSVETVAASRTHLVAKPFISGIWCC